MKRKTAFIVSALLAVGSIASCSAEQTASNTEPDFSADADFVGENDNTAETASRNGTAAEANQEKKKFEVFVEKPAIEETVLVDEKDIKITAKGLEYSGSCAELRINIENNSDKDLSFVSGSIGYSCNSINGYMTGSLYIYEDVPAGKKVNKTVSISEDDLRLYCMRDIAEIEIGFEIKDNDYKRHLVTGPIQIKTSIYDGYDFSSVSFEKAVTDKIIENDYDYTVDYFSDKEIYNENGVRIISQSVITNKSGEKRLYLETENNSSEPIDISAGGISINGLTVCDSDWTTDTVNAGKRGLMYISFDSLLDKQYKELFGITDISDVSMYITGRNADYDVLISPKEISVNISSGNNSFDNSGVELFNDGGIRIVSKGLTEDSSSYRDDIHLILFAENKTSSQINLSDMYGSLSVNGYMVKYYCPSRHADPGRSVLIDVDIYSDSLKDSGIEKIEDIEEIEITFDVRDEKYDTIAEPEFLIKFD